jgi:hypothetical protein
VSAASAAEYYEQETAAGRRVTGKQLAEKYSKSASWGAQTLRKLKAGSTTVVHVPAREKYAHKPAEAVQEVTAPAEEVPDAATGGRAVAWLAFVLGTSLSVAANVLEAPNDPAAKLAWGAVPLLLLVSVEVLMRVRWKAGGQGWKVAGYAGAVVVALVAAVVSYSHQRALMLAMGDSVLNATIIPLAVDGLLLVGGVALLRGKRRGES